MSGRKSKEYEPSMYPRNTLLGVDAGEIPVWAFLIPLSEAIMRKTRPLREAIKRVFETNCLNR